MIETAAQRTGAALRTILRRVSDPYMRLRASELAYNMIKDDKFDSEISRWDSFLDALQIVVEGVLLAGG